MKKRRSRAHRKQRLKFILLVTGLFLTASVLIVLFQPVIQFRGYTARESAPPDAAGDPILRRPGGYAVFQTIPLSPKANGVDGLFEVWSDQDLLIYTYVDKLHQELTNPYARVDLRKFKPSILRWLDRTGLQEKQRVILGLGTACYDGQVDLYGDGRPVFQFDQFTSTETYKDIKTQFVEIKDGHLVPLNFCLEERKYNDPRLEMAWKMEPAPNRRGRELLVFSSEFPPGHPGGKSVLKFVRYSFDGTRWLRKEKAVWGTRDPQVPFPNRALFP